MKYSLSPMERHNKFAQSLLYTTASEVSVFLKNFVLQPLSLFTEAFGYTICGSSFVEQLVDLRTP